MMVREVKPEAKNISKARFRLKGTGTWGSHPWMDPLQCVPWQLISSFLARFLHVMEGAIFVGQSAHPIGRFGTN